MVLGKARAKQYYADDHTRSRSMPVLLHGDGAFSGQVGRGVGGATFVWVVEGGGASCGDGVFSGQVQRGGQ